MSYKSELNKEEQVRWEEFKRQIVIDREEGIFKDPANLGNCRVNVSMIEGKLTLELVPNETSDMNGGVEGVIVSVYEDDCHVTSIMSMAENAKDVEEAKCNKKPIKKFDY